MNTINKILIFITLLSGIVIIQSCQEVVNIKLNPQKVKRIVVEGRVTTDYIHQQVRLTYTTSYFEDQLVPPVLNANVYIEEEEDGTIYPMQLVDSVYGYYQSSDQFSGNVDKTYILHITDGSNTYKASAFLKHVAHIDSINYEYKYNARRKRGFYHIRMSALEPEPVGDYYMFNLYVNDTLYNTNLNMTAYADDLIYNGKYLANAEIYALPQEEIRQHSNKITLKMYSITKEEYNYISDFITETYNNGSIFNGPPANIPSNVINTSGGMDGVGFFGASAISYGVTTLIKVHADSTNDPNYKHGQ